MPDPIDLPIILYSVNVEMFGFFYMFTVRGFYIFPFAMDLYTFINSPGSIHLLAVLAQSMRIYDNINCIKAGNEVISCMSASIFANVSTCII